MYTMLKVDQYKVKQEEELSTGKDIKCCVLTVFCSPIKMCVEITFVPHMEKYCGSVFHDSCIKCASVLNCNDEFVQVETHQRKL